MKTLYESIFNDDDIMNDADNAVFVEDIKKFLAKNYNLENEDDYTITPSGKTYIVDSPKWVTVMNYKLKHLTDKKFKFGDVGGFAISYCNKLKTLEGCPTVCRGTFSVHSTSLEELDYMPKYAKNISLSDCRKLKSLYGCPDKIDGMFDCTSCWALKSLEGAPTEIGDWFSCRNCRSLETLKGIPAEIPTFLSASNCKNLKDISDMPKVGEYADFLKCPHIGRNEMYKYRNYVKKRVFKVTF